VSLVYLEHTKPLPLLDSVTHVHRALQLLKTQQQQLYLIHRGLHLVMNALLVTTSAAFPMHALPVGWVPIPMSPWQPPAMNAQQAHLRQRREPLPAQHAAKEPTKPCMAQAAAKHVR